MKNKESKLLLIFFVLIVSFLIIEISLRISGYIVLREARKHICAGQPPEDTIRILCLSDSSTFGLGASYDYSYPRQLEEMLKENNPEKDIVVYNLGVPGCNSSQVLKDLPQHIERLMPDVIIVMAGINNDPFLRYSNYWLFANIKEIGIKQYILRKSDYFLSNMRSYELIKILFLNLRTRLNQLLFSKARIQLIESKKDSAIDIKQDDEDVELCLNQGESYFYERKYELAIEQARKALALDSKCERGHLLLAYAYNEVGEYELAELAAEKVLGINPGNYRANLVLGEVYLRQGKIMEDLKEENSKLAIEILRKAIELNPNDVQAYLILAAVYDELGRKGLAAEAAKTALKIKPENIELKRLLSTYLPFLLIPDLKIFKKVFRYDLNKLIELAKDRKIKTILLGYPDVDYLDDIRKEVAETKKVIFIEVYSIFKELLESEGYAWKDLFSGDGSHCNAHGYRIIAEQTYRSVKLYMDLGIK